jgi:hypothetical protein
MISAVPISAAQSMVIQEIDKLIQTPFVYPTISLQVTLGREFFSARKQRTRRVVRPNYAGLWALWTVGNSKSMGETLNPLLSCFQRIFEY